MTSQDTTFIRKNYKNLSDDELGEALGVSPEKVGRERRAMNLYRKSRDGRSKDPLYKVWYRMIDRCTNPDRKDYQYYGGRGVNVCQKWLKFENFRQWAEESGFKPELVLGRKSVKRGYSPSNCEWTTLQQQHNRRGNNRVLKAFGEKKTLAEWTRDSRCPVGQGTLLGRIQRGWETERAISSPAR